MYPIFFQIGSITIHSYGVLLAISVVVCSFLFAKDAAKFGISRDMAFDFLFWLTLGGILGARIFYVMISWDLYENNPWDILMFNRGGLAWQGGFIGGLVAGLAFVRIKKLPLRLMMDLAAPYIALGQAIGRIGCFFNGCCYGKLWKFGIYFPVHQARLHPTQLYETLLLAIIYFILKAVPKSNWPAGMVFVLYLWLAAIERFTVEFFRADHDTLVGGFSLFQFIAIGVFVAGIVAFIRFKK